MFCKVFRPFAALLGLGLLASAALAAETGAGASGDDGIRVWKPYVIEKNCAEHFSYCKVRMDYAPFQRAMVAKPGSYWYQKPFLAYRYGDFGQQRAMESGANPAALNCGGAVGTGLKACDDPLGSR